MKGLDMKILISPGWGAGWSTWNSSSVPGMKNYLMTYQPIIDFIESGGDVNDFRNENHPILEELKKNIKEKFGSDYVCVLGAHQLIVKNVEPPFRVTEYDGYETVEWEYGMEWNFTC